MAPDRIHAYKDVRINKNHPAKPVARINGREKHLKKENLGIFRKLNILSDNLKVLKTA